MEKSKKSIETFTVKITADGLKKTLGGTGEPVKSFNNPLIYDGVDGSTRYRVNWLTGQCYLL